MQIEDVQRGDIIKQHGGKDIEVKKKIDRACSPSKVHINDRYCWDRGTPVTVTQRSEETGVGDLIIDEVDLEAYMVPFDSTHDRELQSSGR